MSIYDQRNIPAYSSSFDDYSNRNIDVWWQPEHDVMILTLIEKYQWNWYWEVSSEVEKITNKNILAHLLQQDAWYNKVMKFAVTRAKALGYTNLVRLPKQKNCPLCNNSFCESSLPHPLVKRLGIDNLDFCSPCLRYLVLQSSGNNDTSKVDALNYIIKLTSLIEKIPPQSYGEGMNDLIDLDFNKRLELLELFKTKPTIKRVKILFGSWLKALIEAGVLLNGTRETARGIQTFANDGHLCLSLGEKTIDDYLFKCGISHSREPKYPNSNYRADFLIGEVFVEYFGLAGELSYDKKIQEKRGICKIKNIKLIEIYPQDIITISKLDKIFLSL